jgi:hypothetical protein
MAIGVEHKPSDVPHAHPGLWYRDQSSAGWQADIALEAQPEDAAAGRPALRWVPAGDVDVAALSSSVRKIHALAAAARAAARPR